MIFPNNPQGFKKLCILYFKMWEHFSCHIKPGKKKKKSKSPNLKNWFSLNSNCIQISCVTLVCVVFVSCSDKVWINAFLKMYQQVGGLWEIEFFVTYPTLYPIQTQWQLHSIKHSSALLSVRVRWQHWVNLQVPEPVCSDSVSVHRTCFKSVHFIVHSQKKNDIIVLYVGK